MKVLHEASQRVITTYALVFTLLGQEFGSGYSFPCDKHGNVKRSGLPASALDNLIKCLAGEHSVGPGVVDERVQVINDSLVIECFCGRPVECDGFTNTCDCGRDYNFSGSCLAPRSQWGEETGETAAEIMMGAPSDW